MSGNRHRVELYFDFVSPYSYLALTQLDGLGERLGVDWVLRPVVYGALLDATGLVGPAEVAIKRRYTFQDVTRTAGYLGVPMVGPPAHPFRSLEALRTVCLFQDSDAVVGLAVGLARACWGRGEDLTDPEILARTVSAVGLDPTDLLERLSTPGIKQRLRDNTDAALQAGVFGVPTFRLGSELFWGHDRIDMLAARIAGRLGPGGSAAAMEARPRGIDRRTAPLGSGLPEDDRRRPRECPQE